MHGIPIHFDLDSERSVVNGGVDFLFTKSNMNKKLKYLEDYINYSVHTSFTRNSNPFAFYFDPSKGFCFDFHAFEIDFIALSNNFIRLMPLVSNSKIYNQTKSFRFSVRSDFLFTLKYRMNQNTATDESLYDKTERG